MSMMREILGDTFDIQVRCLCPTQIGAGAMRLRQWSIGVLRERGHFVLDFAGPEFGRLFHWYSCLTAQDYFVASAEERGEAVKDMAARRAAFNLGGSATKRLRRSALPDHLSKALTPGGACRLEGYRRLMTTAPWKDSPALVCSIDQNPDSRQRLKTMVPTLLRSSDLVLIKSNNIEVGDGLLLTANEHLNVMGWPMYDESKVNLLRDVHTQLEPFFKKQLAGNGMHVGIAGAVLLFLMASLVLNEEGGLE